MANNKSNFLRNAIINWMLRGSAAPTLAASVYVALYTTTLDATDAGTEVVGNNYSRVAVLRDNASWTAPTTGITANVAQITFPIPSASWGTIRSVGVRDASSGGNLLLLANLSSPLVIDNTTVAPRIPVGDLDYIET